jgi:hypothetical protein
MIKIGNTYSEYNENILTSDFTFDNILAWQFTVGGGGTNTVGTSTDEHFVGEKSLKIYHDSYNLNDITVRPTIATDYDFVIPRDGTYIFSLRAFIAATNPWLPEISGGLSFYANGGGSPYHTCTLTIGNNAEPELSFNYNKWQTFYEEITFLAGDVITLSIHITYESSFTPGELTIYFDGFKLEYIDDRDTILPTLYSQPIN